MTEYVYILTYFQPDSGKNGEKVQINIKAFNDFNEAITSWLELKLDDPNVKMHQISPKFGGEFLIAEVPDSLLWCKCWELKLPKPEGKRDEEKR